MSRYTRKQKKSRRVSAKSLLRDYRETLKREVLAGAEIIIDLRAELRCANREIERLTRIKTA